MIEIGAQLMMIDDLIIVKRESKMLLTYLFLILIWPNLACNLFLQFIVKTNEFMSHKQYKSHKQ